MSLALDGPLEPADQQWFDRHLAGCAACQAEWQAIQQVSTLFEQSPMVGPPLGFAIRVERKLEAKTKKRRQSFGGLAVLTGSLSLAGVTLAAVAIIVLGVVAWQWLAPTPAVHQGTSAVTQLASGVGLMGKGANLFLKDLLVRYGPLLVALIGTGLAVLAGFWAWLVVKRPGSTRHNGYV
jgi:predicted anti-sigma-YlaC factor YlaD